MVSLSNHAVSAVSSGRLLRLARHADGERHGDAAACHQREDVARRRGVGLRRRRGDGSDRVTVLEVVDREPDARRGQSRRSAGPVCRPREGQAVAVSDLTRGLLTVAKIARPGPSCRRNMSSERISIEIPALRKN